MNFCDQVMGQPNLAYDKRYSSNNLRVENREALDAQIELFFSVMDRGAIEMVLRDAKIAYGFVNSVEALSNHPQLRRWPVELPSGEHVQLVAPPMQMESDQQEFGRVPAVGEHNDLIRAEFSAEQ